MHGTYMGEGRVLIKPIWGGHLFVPASDMSLTPYLLSSGVFEAPLTNFILNRVKPGDVVFDIGGHTGYFTILMGFKVGPSGKVVTYEPDPFMFQFLSDNVGTNYLHQQIELHNKAAFSHEEELILHASSKFTGHNSIYGRDGEELRKFDTQFDPFVQEVKVQAEALDKYADTYSRIDLLKIDIEGAEYDAFKGMKRLFKENILQSGVFEWNRQGMGNRLPDFVELLKELQRETGMSFYFLDAAGNPVPTNLEGFLHVEFIHNILLSKNV